MYRDIQWLEKDGVNDGKPEGNRQQRTSPEGVQTFRDKRPFDKDGVYDGNPEGKRRQRPLASMMLEGVMRNALQSFSSNMEPMLRRIVSEEVERALTKLAPITLGARISSLQIQGSDSRNLRLQFKSSLPRTLFTGSRVEGEEGSAIHVILQDALTGQVVTTGPESSVKLNVVVLEGDFPHDDGENWSQEDFERYEVRERTGKRPLLIGDLTVSLRNGVGTLGEVLFTDNSSWIKSRKFRIAVKVALGFCRGLRIREAMTQAFMVKDRRGELYKKHFPPELYDEVWRLQNIGKGGTFHTKLSEAGISTVEEFLKEYVKDEERLKAILGGSMSMKMWESTVQHAKTCLFGGKLFVFYTDDTRNIGIIFDRICQLIGITINGDFREPEKLANIDKVYVDKMVKVAYENWDRVVEYDGEALVDGMQYGPTGTRNCIEDQITHQGSGGCTTLRTAICIQESCLASKALPVPHTPFAAAAGRSRTDEVLANMYEPEMTYTDHAEQANERSQVGLPIGMNMGYDPFINALSMPEQNLVSHDMETRVSLPLQSMVPFSFGCEFDLKFLAESSHFTNGWTADNTGNIDNNFVMDLTSIHIDNNATEEEIRTGSNEMLQGEEMQGLLQVMLHDTAGQSFWDTSNDNYFHHGIGSTDVCFHKNGSQTLCRASVGWLKVKAALRWAIFIRKLVAKKRAKLVELEDQLYC